MNPADSYLNFSISLIAFLLRHRAALNWALLWGAVALAGATALAGVAVDHPNALPFLAGYMAPLFLFAPLWARLRLRSIESASPGAVWTDAAVLALGAARTPGVLPLPFSGHMLFLTYALLTTRSLGYRAVALAMLLGTTWFKLRLWHDPVSWSWGLGMGVAAGVVYHLIEHRRGRSGGASTRAR